MNIRLRSGLRRCKLDAICFVCAHAFANPTRPAVLTLKFFRSNAISRSYAAFDIRRFEALNWLHHFIGGEYTAFCQRIGQLYDGGYIGRVKEHLHHDTVHARHLIYFITDKGRRVLNEHSITPVFKTTKQYLHECLTAFVYDGLEYGAAERSFKFIGWDKLQHDKRVHARHQEHPFAIKLPSGKYLRLDGTPVVFGHPDLKRG